MANYQLGPVIGKIGGGGNEVQEWYYNHPDHGNIPPEEQNPVIAKVEEATPGEPVIVLLETNMTNYLNHNMAWEEIVGHQSGGGGNLSTGKQRYAFLATEPGELRLTRFDSYMSRGEFHTRAYISRLSDYAPI